MCEKGKKISKIKFWFPLNRWSHVEWWIQWFQSVCITERCSYFKIQIYWNK